jgi:hypothetical protein
MLPSAAVSVSTIWAYEAVEVLPEGGVAEPEPDVVNRLTTLVVDT